MYRVYMFVFPANNEEYRKRKRALKACEQCKRRRVGGGGDYNLELTLTCRNDVISHRAVEDVNLVKRRIFCAV